MRSLQIGQKAVQKMFGETGESVQQDSRGGQEKVKREPSDR